ncbi:MAG TPA: hypothetical protein VFZ41_08920 [Solirubrobacterales bacterium]
MFDERSRYADVAEATVTLPDGREVAYKLRRILPPSASLPTLSEERVGAADRLDLIAARALGDPEQFWRICDANDALDPRSLIEEGRALRIPMPGP